MASGQENRRSVRRKVDLILELYEPDGKLIVGVGRLLDLSLHGALFQTTLPLQVGQAIHLLLRLDEKLLLEIPSKVIYEKPKQNLNAFGAEFINLSPYTKEKMTAWMHHHTKKA